MLNERVDETIGVHALDVGVHVHIHRRRHGG